MPEEMLQNQDQDTPAPAQAAPSSQSGQPGQSQPVTLDMSKSVPLSQPDQAAPVTLDMSKSIPLGAPKTITNTEGETLPVDVAIRHAKTRQGKDFADHRPESVQVLDSLATGVGKEGLKTAQGVVGLANNIPGVNIPTPGGLSDTELVGPAEHIGAFGETLAEFASGEEILKGLSKVAKIEKLAASSPMVASILKKTPGLVKKIVTTATKGAALGGAQGAVKEAGPSGEGALQGAKEGALGGAVGGAAAEVTGAVAKPLAKAVGLGTSSEEDIIRAAQPGKRNYRFIKDWSLAKDRIANELEENGKFKDLGEAADRIRDVRQNLWRDEVAPVIANHANETFDTSAMANKVRNSISPQMLQHAPEQAKIMQEFADKYTSGTPNFSGARSVADAEKDLEFFNAELEKEGYWKKSPQERAGLRKVDGKIASRATAVESLRDGLYQYLEDQGEPGMKDLKQTYGAIKNVENEIRGQVNVAGRQRPVSLKTIIGIASGEPLGIAASLLDKIYNAPEEILNRGVKKSQPPGPVKALAQDAALGTGIVAKKAAPVAGAALVRAVGSDGLVYMVPENKKDEVLQKDPGAKFE